MADEEVDSYKLIPPSRRWIVALLLALSNFMVVLDLTIANVSVPHIAGNLGISPNEGTWVITSYAVAEAICVPLTGWLALRFGTVRIFVLSMIGFGFFSFLCGVSPTLDMLVLSRLGQGICGGPLMPMSQTLLMRVFPPEDRPRAIGLWAMTTILGPAVGPIIGGAISDNWSWHWIFFINLPVAAIATAGCIAMLRKVETPRQKVPIDRVGLILLIFWIGSLQLMLDLGRERDWFGDPMIVGLGIAAVIGFCAFLIWELTEEHPIVDLRIFRYRGFTFGVISLALCFGAYFASIVVIPQWLQTAVGYTAMQAGVVTALTAIAALMSAQVAVRLLPRMDARLLMSVGVAWLGIMSLWRTQWTSGMDWWAIAIPQFLQGFGMPLFMLPLTSITLSAVNPSETASAAGLQNFLRTMATAVATSLALTFWTNFQRTSRSEIVSTFHPESVQQSLGNLGFTNGQTLQTLSNLVEQEATILALNHLFLMTAFILFIAAATVWLTPKPKAIVSPGAGGH